MITNTNIEGQTTLFDSLIDLKDDQEAFDKLTKQVMEDYISSMPEDRQERMRRMQWKIDQELNKYKNPTNRYNHMVEMFYDHIEKFYSKDGKINMEPQVHTKAPVLEFKKKKKNKEDKI